MRNDKSNHRRPGIVLLPFVLILSSTVTSFAHPMGNFSVNHYAKIKVDQGSIEIKYLIDMAEIPTLLLRPTPPGPPATSTCRGNS